MKFKEKIVMTICLTVCLLMSFCMAGSCVSADNEIDVNFDGIQSTDGYNSKLVLLAQPQGRTVCVSSRGNRLSFPENTTEAVQAAINDGADLVLVDIRKTSDNILVVFGHDTTEEMFYGEEVKAVADMTFAELTAVPLSDKQGGKNAGKTKIYVPSLEEMLKDAADNGYALILNTPAGLLGEVGTLLQSSGAYLYCAVMTDAGADTVSAAFAGLQNKPYVIGVKRSNIVFSVTGYINDFADISAVGVNLRTTNRYGVNFNQTVLKKFTDMRAVADTSDPVTCGAREDCEKWWDDLITRGYSVIITDFPDLFADYLSRCDAARARLANSYDEYVKNGVLPQFKNENLNDYKKAYTDAVAFSEKLLDDASSSYKDLTDANAALVRAVREININFAQLEVGTAGKTVTAPRIILCIAAAAVVVAVQIYFYKKRKKGIGETN